MVDVGLVAFSREEVTGMQDVRCGVHQRGVGLLGIDAGLAVHHPWFPEEPSGEELEVEAHLSHEEVGHWFVEVNGHDNALALTLHPHLVAELIVGIYHRVESCHVTGGVGIAQAGGNSVALGFSGELFRNGLPLSRCSLHADIAIGSHALTVHNYTHTALMSFWVKVAECHYVNAMVIEIAVGQQREILCGNRLHQQP